MQSAWAWRTESSDSLLLAYEFKWVNMRFSLLSASLSWLIITHLIPSKPKYELGWVSLSFPLHYLNSLSPILSHLNPRYGLSQVSPLTFSPKYLFFSLKFRIFTQIAPAINRVDRMQKALWNYTCELSGIARVARWDWVGLPIIYIRMRAWDPGKWIM